MKKLLLLLLLPLTFSCQSTQSSEEEKIPEHYYSEVEDKFIDFSKTLSLEGDYYVYCFSKTCKYCDELKNRAIDVALKKQNIYFCNQNIVTMDLDPSTTIGVKDISLLFVRGFPSIINVSSNEVKGNVVGKSSVEKILRSL